MSQELPKTYDPAETETAIYTRWEQAGIFAPSQERKAPAFCLINPPTNANGVLHIGHAVGVTLQDLMVRYHRMKGDATLWLPGFDHAGFETQVVYEKKLEKEGRSRLDIPREQLYQEMLNFTLAHRALMIDQLKKLGASLDWSKEKFTLDPDVVKIVYQTFKQLYDDGLAYRGERPVNWCPQHQTSLSDLEATYEERDDTLYYFKYGPFTIGTARPETKFGDKYVVMHPLDTRYKQYEPGQTIELEWVNGPVTATVIKDEAVDMEFGTGVMTITPWHDPLDFEIAKRHNLDMEPIIDKRDKLLPIAGEFAGRHMSKARPLIVAKLKAKGLFDETRTNYHYKHNVQVCYKCRTPIEPQVMPQWFVAMTKTGRSGKNLRDDAVAAVKNGKVNFVTKHFEKIFFHWMENLHDWNISRQIVWGIQLPVFYCQKHEVRSTSSALRDEPLGSDSNEKPAINSNDKNSKCEPIVTDGTIPEACPTCGGSDLERDPDVFDTWFSSGQWPFAALQTQSDSRLPTTDKPTTDHGNGAVDSRRSAVSSDYQRFYPTDLMETGYDILFFWVARMIMLGLYATDQVPFKTVYLHGLVRDKDRQKMSKSKGNIIDPLGVAEQYGSDAVRMALVFGTAAGSDIVISEDKIRGMRNLANKLWNVARFALMNQGLGITNQGLGQLQPQTKADKNIIEGLNRLTEEVTQHIENFQFHLAAMKLYDFTWHEFADSYIEVAKEQLKKGEKIAENTGKILLHTLLTLVSLLHPFMPFVTEAVYQSLPIEDKEPLLASANWPSIT